MFGEEICKEISIGVQTSLHQLCGSTQTTSLTCAEGLLSVLASFHTKVVHHMPFENEPLQTSQSFHTEVAWCIHVQLGCHYEMGLEHFLIPMLCATLDRVSSINKAFTPKYLNN